MSHGLHTTELGERGSRVVFCHGLFGQGRNWTQIAKGLADRHRVTLVDLPDHGRSAWTRRFSYLGAAERVAALLSAEDPVALVGHSMGGKIAMLLTLHRPELVERLCVVDVAPVGYDRVGEFAAYIEAMQALDLDRLERRQDADDALAPAAPDPLVRGFLLQNLRRDHQHWRWQPNLEVLGRDLAALGGWPEEELADVSPYSGPVLWIAGAESDYVREEYAGAMARWFPRSRRVTIKAAGHWVHSEQPAVFAGVLTRFLDKGGHP